MNTFAQALTYAIPGFLLLILIEELVARYRGMAVNRGLDAVSSLSSGITNVTKDVLGLSIAIITYPLMLKHLAIFQLEATWPAFVIAFVAKDFAGYWAHRLEHEVNFLWNRHIIHHSSEEFNLSCALRQSISEIFQLFTVFMLPAAVLGVPVGVIAVVAPIQLFAQFWYHTRVIGKMGLLEYILVTPSHHRVHHAMNGVYLDKNYGQIFIIWDKIFGTFQPELAEVQPVFGVKRPVKTWNPIRIGFQHFGLLFMDAWRTQNWADKFRIWFKPTGWRPADVAALYPVNLVEDFGDFEKYDTHPSRALVIWSWVQLVATLLLMFHLFGQLANIGLMGSLVYGGFIFVSVYSYTTLMDKSRWAVLLEVGRLTFCLALVWWRGGDWFGIGQTGTAALVSFLFFSLVIAVFFTNTALSRQTTVSA